MALITASLQVLLASHLDLSFCIAVLLATLAFWWYRHQSKRLPPGPWGLPLVGLLPRILYELRSGSHPHLLFAKLTRRFGTIFRFNLVNKTLVILNDYTSVKQAFQNPHLSDRPPNTLIAQAMKSEGVAMSSGKKWKDLRQFSLTVLRSLGVGRATFEHQIGTEAEALIREISSHKGQEFNPKLLFGNAVANVICSVVVGKRYEYSDPTFSNLMRVIHRIVNLIGSGGLKNAIPAMRVFTRNKADVFATFGEFRRFLLDVVASHRSNFDLENLQDFTDAYLMEIIHNEEANESHSQTSVTEHPRTLKHPHLNDNNIVGTLGNLFAAGMETTATTLLWAIVYMMAHPDIQRRVHAEIDTVVGRNRLPRLADKPELNITQAVLWEVQRISVVVPLGMPHAASADTEVQGFAIHKGTIVISNLWALFRDEKVWPEPAKFKPERFLDTNGRAFKPDELIPFSTGRRSCIGEHLAKMELFIFFTYFMHQFTFKKPDDSPPLTFEAQVGLTRYPLPFKTCALLRE